MAMTGKFEWLEKHQLAWKAVLLLATMGFENHVVDRNKTLFVATDASQIALSYVVFQIVQGDIKLISTDSRILKTSDRNKASSFRESISLMFALISNEHQIKVIWHK